MRCESVTCCETFNLVIYVRICETCYLDCQPLDNKSSHTALNSENICNPDSPNTKLQI